MIELTAPRFAIGLAIDALRGHVHLEGKAGCTPCYRAATNVLCLFLVELRVGLMSVFMAFPGHTHFLNTENCN